MEEKYLHNVIENRIKKNIELKDLKNKVNIFSIRKDLWILKMVKNIVKIWLINSTEHSINKVLIIINNGYHNKTK